MPRNFGMAGGPLGNTVIIPTGPCLYFSIMASDFISPCAQKAKTYRPRFRPAARSAAMRGPNYKPSRLSHEYSNPQVDVLRAIQKLTCHPLMNYENSLGKNRGLAPMAAR